jgi:glycosyltransferase involved in cell wall biosynthesis
VYELLIAGEGPEEEPLKQLCHKLRVSSNVQFLGRVERDAMQKLLPQCDIFVLPSYAEGMSNAALEALACGLPLILTDTGGTSELINENGYIVPAGDDLILADKLMNLCEDSELRMQMGIESRKHAVSFSWQNIAKQYDELYREVL